MSTRTDRFLARVDEIVESQAPDACKLWRRDCRLAQPGRLALPLRGTGKEWRANAVPRPPLPDL